MKNNTRALMPRRALKKDTWESPVEEVLALAAAPNGKGTAF